MIIETFASISNSVGLSSKRMGKIFNYVVGQDDV